MSDFDPNNHSSLIGYLLDFGPDSITKSLLGCQMSSPNYYKVAVGASDFDLNNHKLLLGYQNSNLDDANLLQLWIACSMSSTMWTEVRVFMAPHAMRGNCTSIDIIQILGSIEL